MKHHEALVVVDMQNDFVSGTLLVPQAKAILPEVNRLIGEAVAAQQTILFTRCWHPADHCSFIKYGGIWPEHCVAFTWGADYPNELFVPYKHYNFGHISKGQDRYEDQYSAVQAGLAVVLLYRNIRKAKVCGVATEYCVKSTALDLRSMGFQVEVPQRAIAGLAGAEVALHELQEANVELT